MRHGGDQVDSGQSRRTWSDVVKITKYLTDIRDGRRHAQDYGADISATGKPASTMVCINQLSVARRARRARHDRGDAEEVALSVTGQDKE